MQSCLSIQQASGCDYRIKFKRQFFEDLELPYE